MKIGMNLPVMVPGLNRERILEWSRRIDAGPYASLAAGERITLPELPENVVVSPKVAPGGEAAPSLCLKAARKSLEANMIRRALRTTEGNRTHAAKLLDISHRALLYKIKEYDIRN